MIGNKQKHHNSIFYSSISIRFIWIPFFEKLFALGTVERMQKRSTEKNPMLTSEPVGKIENSIARITRTTKTYLFFFLYFI